MYSLKMDAAGPSETSVPIYQSTGRNIRDVLKVELFVNYKTLYVSIPTLASGVCDECG
jgi:hypothetical protein